MSKRKQIALARISTRGVVQGVGFRPFVYQLATRYQLNGWVRNTSDEVQIEVEGVKADIDSFFGELQEKAPPLSHIENIAIEYRAAVGHKHFKILGSKVEADKYQLISPDIATCELCRQEVFSPEGRRYRYPFTNCTNCGPRFTIIEDIPYDRQRTTMREFKMCPDCQAEYNNPLDRRFHAQPNACPVCGPGLELLDAGGNKVNSTDPVKTTAELIRAGKIIAIKGLGGFLLACDATRDTTVQRLRDRKKRPSKPLAVMVSDINEAHQHGEISTEEEKLLTSSPCPIVLLWGKAGSTVCASVAPNIKYLGMMLPYTPLHHLLLNEIKLPLVMTSGNISEEPIAKDNEEALSRLSGIADYFLVHNRDIYACYDDSVTFVELGKPQIIRRARGYAPFPIKLPFSSKQILACGADEKNTFCLTRDNYAFISQHIGDLENPEALEHLENTRIIYEKLFRIKPEIITCDLHPDYFSTKYARELAEKLGNINVVLVQHHHAHIVSCMAENNVQNPVIGVALDGTGYGTDGNIWGGEFMVADYHGFTRMGHLEYLPLPGGELAIKRPYRIAIGYLATLPGENAGYSGLRLLNNLAEVEANTIKRQVQNKINTPLTSSMGRLFDAVSAVIGIRGVIDYEAQAAIELETAAYEYIDSTGDQKYPFAIEGESGVFQIKLKNLFSAIIADLSAKVATGTISAKFHNSVASMVGETCLLIKEKTKIEQVALSGGVFQNRLLLKKVVKLLESRDFQVLTHRQVPCNDGGISLGQAVIANFTTSREYHLKRNKNVSGSTG
jgi:hydrogenase maturation protein HypF